MLFCGFKALVRGSKKSGSGEKIWAGGTDQYRKKCLFVKFMCLFLDHKGGREKERKRVGWDVSVEFIHRHCVFFFCFFFSFARPRAGPGRFGKTLRMSRLYKKRRIFCGFRLVGIGLLIIKLRLTRNPNEAGSFSFGAHL